MGRPNKVVDNETFIRLWNKFDHALGVDPVVEEIARIAQETGREPLSKETIVAKAGNLRRAGVELPKKKTGRPTLDVDYLNQLVRETRAQGMDPLDAIDDVIGEMGR